MAYAVNVGYNMYDMPRATIQRNYMKHNCIYCHLEFDKLSSDKTCSMKCKLLDGIVKTDNGCWLFKNSSSGIYSKVRWNVKWFLAHRVSYEVFIGPIEKGKLVCHKCDTPKCINPEHLFVGTAKDNAQDRIKKGRYPMGEKNNFTILSDNQVEEMRLLRSEGFTYARLTRVFNCSQSNVIAIVKRKIRIGV